MYSQRPLFCNMKLPSTPTKKNLPILAGQALQPPSSELHGGACYLADKMLENVSNLHEGCPRYVSEGSVPREQERALRPLWAR